MGTEAKLWTLGALRSARADPAGAVEVDPGNPIVFSIPAFQRSLVWPEAKQRALIDSILKGFPFGALLLVEYPDKREVNLPNGQKVMAANYGIIDGLQRTNAIVEHLRQPLTFATEEAVRGDIFDAFLTEVEAQLGVTVEPDQLMDAVVNWMRATKSTDITTGFDFDSLLTEVARHVGVPQFSQSTIAALKAPASQLVQQIEQKVDIKGIQIPVLIYNGPSEHLADIFEQINTAGTILSKYEVYAAAWVSTEVQVARKEVRDAIARRSKSLEDEGFDVEPSNTSADTFSLFEYLHGLSQFLGERYPVLFSARDAARNKASSAFPLATLMLGETLDKMSQLNGLFPSGPTGLEVGKFETALLKSADLVNEILRPFLAFKFTSDTESLAHGELQMVSIVAAVAAHLFDHSSDFRARGSARSRAAATVDFKTSIPQHYIYDIIRQQWRGSLYTYASERVWDGLIPAMTYRTPVDATSFDSALATAFAEQMADVSHKRKNVTASDRIFLKFLYSPIVTVQEQAAHKFDVEHWIPVGRIQKMTAAGEPWPMGALGNLGVLPMATNRIKQDETATEYLGRTTKKPTADEARIVKKMVLGSLTSVAIPKRAGLDAMTRQGFIDFVSANWTEMCNTLKAQIAIGTP